MKTKLNIMANLALGLALTGAVATAGPSSQPRSLAEQIRHQILTTPYIGVFDNVAYQVDNGVVTLSGQVVEAIEKDYIDRAVKHVNGVTRVDNQIEVLPVSPFDTQIRFQALRSLRSAPSLGKYFLGTQPSIRIIVRNGHVALEGVVLNNGDRIIADMRANQIPGVFSVTDNLLVEQRPRP